MSPVLWESTPPAAPFDGFAKLTMGGGDASDITPSEKVIADNFTIDGQGGYELTRVSAQVYRVVGGSGSTGTPAPASYVFINDIEVWAWEPASIPSGYSYADDTLATPITLNEGDTIRVEQWGPFLNYNHSMTVWIHPEIDSFQYGFFTWAIVPPH